MTEGFLLNHELIHDLLFAGAWSREIGISSGVCKLAEPLEDAEDWPTSLPLPKCGEDNGVEATGEFDMSTRRTFFLDAGSDGELAEGWGCEESFFSRRGAKTEANRRIWMGQSERH